MIHIDLLHELAKQRHQELRLLAAKQHQPPSRASPVKTLHQPSLASRSSMTLQPKHLGTSVNPFQLSKHYRTPPS